VPNDYHELQRSRECHATLNPIGLKHFARVGCGSDVLRVACAGSVGVGRIVGAGHVEDDLGGFAEKSKPAA